MERITTGDLLREMTAADVPAVLDVQQPAAVAGLAEVFPQDRYPFPREAVAARWHAEIADPQTECLVVLDDGRVAGFAAVRGAELPHLGVALDLWGSGLAPAAHDAVLDRDRRAQPQHLPAVCRAAALRACAQAASVPAKICHASADFAVRLSVT